MREFEREREILDQRKTRVVGSVNAGPIMLPRANQ